MTQLDTVTIKQNFENKSIQELLDILSYSQDDYQSLSIQILIDVLTERGVSMEEIETCKSSYEKLRDNIRKQPHSYKRANFFPRFLQYIADHFICFGLVYLLQGAVHFTIEEQGAYYASTMGVYVLFYALFLGLFKATPGMLILGLMVIENSSKKPINFSLSLARGVAMVLNFITLNIGHLFMLEDSKLTLVDRVTGTSVVYSK